MDKDVDVAQDLHQQMDIHLQSWRVRRKRLMELSRKGGKCSEAEAMELAKLCDSFGLPRQSVRVQETP